MDLKKFRESDFHNKIEGFVNHANALRLDAERPTDITFAEMIEDQTKLSVDDFYDNIGVDPAFDTIQNIFTTVDKDVRWLVPEIIRDSLRLGYKSAPIWPTITAMEEQVAGLQQILPHINMSSAVPRRVGEGETIPLGDLSYGSKNFRIYKYGRGIKITDEVIRYVSLNVLSIYLQDFGVRMGQGVDNMAIWTLLNGEQADGSEAAPIVGVSTPNWSVKANRDFRSILRIWLRMSKLGRRPAVMLSDEELAMDIWEMPEFNRRTVGGNNPDGAQEYGLNKNVMLPTSANYFVHGGIPAAQVVIMDPSACLMKLNSVPLMVESERIVSNQTQAFYASFTTGFAKMFTETAVALDTGEQFAAGNAGDSSTNFGFPPEMGYDTSWVDMDGELPDNQRT